MGPVPPTRPIAAGAATLLSVLAIAACGDAVGPSQSTHKPGPTPSGQSVPPMRATAGADRAVFGRVVDDAGTPVPSVGVYYLARRYETSASGDFRVPSDPDSELKLTFAREGYVAVAEVVKPASTGIRVVLPRCGRVHGRVLFGDGRPASRAVVEPYHRTASDGTFVVDALEPGERPLRASWEGTDSGVAGTWRGETTVTVQSGEAASAEIVLQPIGASFVTVTAHRFDGTPVPGCLITTDVTRFIEAASTEGRYVARCELDPGTPVGVHLEDPAPRAGDLRTWSALVAAASDLRTTTVTFPDPVRVRIRVVDPAGNAIASDGAGSVELRGPHVRRVGEFWLAPPNVAAEVFSVARGISRRLGTYALPARGDHVIDVSALSGSTVRGRLLNNAGVPAAATRVYITDPYGSKLATASTDESGIFTLADVPEGAAWLVVDCEDAPRPIRRVAVRGAQLEFGDVLIPSPVRLWGRVVDSSGRGVAGARIAYSYGPIPARLTQVSDDAGVFVLSPPPGVDGKLRISMDGLGTGTWDDTPEALAALSVFALRPEALVEVTWPRTPVGNWVAGIRTPAGALVWSAGSDITRKQGVTVTAMAYGLSDGEYTLSWGAGDELFEVPIRAVLGQITRVRATPWEQK